MRQNELRLMRVRSPMPRAAPKPRRRGASSLRQPIGPESNAGSLPDSTLGDRTETIA